MKRGAVLIAVLASLAGASPAAAAILTETSAYASANAYAQRAAYLSGWANRYASACIRRSPWRFSCRAQVWASVPRSPICSQAFDVVSPVIGRQVRLERFGPWACRAALG